MPAVLSLRSLVATAHPARWRFAFLAVLALIVLGMSLKYAAKIEKPGDRGLQSRSAFLRWRTLIHEVFAGTNIYTGVHEYPNPPIMAIVLKPFADLPPVAGAIAWFYAKVLMAALAAVWVFRLVQPLFPYGPAGTSDLWKAVAILLALPPLLGDLSHNNVNIFILFLVAGCLEAYRRGWDWTAGLTLALAIACKVTPLMFLAFFIYKRAGKLVGGCILGLALWLAVVPALTFGWDRNIELFESWYSLMVKPALVDNRVTSEHPNQSIPGVVFRLFTHSPSFIVYPDNIPTPAAFHNVMDIGTDAARWTVKACLATFALMIVILCRSPRTERQGLRFAAECSLIVLGMLLFSERTWKHHAVTLLLPLAVLARWASVSAGARRASNGYIFLFFGVALLTNLPGLLPQHAADLAMVYGSYTAAFLLLTAGIAGLLVLTRAVANSGHA
jgi:alpha-1,2-mannosyltransferase